MRKVVGMYERLAAGPPHERRRGRVRTVGRRRSHADGLNAAISARARESLPAASSIAPSSFVRLRLDVERDDFGMVLVRIAASTRST